MIDATKLAEAVLGTLKGYVDAAYSKLSERLSVVEARDVKDGRDGLPGVPGRDGNHGKDGLNGKDGADGLGFDDMDVEYDGERGLTLRFSQGERLKEFPFTLPIPLDRGQHKAGADYIRGDAVTHGGSLWIAQKATEDKPGTSDAWRLAVKCGRDGKHGKDGERGERGPEGRAGRDLTQIGPDGSKW